MQFINLTPHNIQLVNNAGKAIECQRTHIENGEYLILRATKEVDTKTFLGVQRYKTNVKLYRIDKDGNMHPYESETLPRLYSMSRGKIIFIVSAIALQALKGKFMGCTCVAPCKFIRKNGKIIGARGLIGL